MASALEVVLEEEELEEEVVVQTEEIEEVVCVVVCAEDEGGIEGGSCPQGSGQVWSLHSCGLNSLILL